MRRFILFAVLATSVGGCEKATEPRIEEVAAEERPSQTADIVAVRIDGKDLHRSEIVRDAKVTLQLNMNRARKRKIRKREIKAMERVCRAAVSRAIAKAAVARYVRDRHLEVSSNAVRRATRRFESQYGAMSMKLRRRHNINDIKYMLGENASCADAMIMEMALFETMTNDLLKTSGFSITGEMIADRMLQIEKANERAAATNACIFARATNVWKKIVAKELTFEDAAAKFSEDEYIRDGCEWGCFTLDQLQGEDGVLALLPTIKAGDVTPPVESDGGLAILRKEEDDNPTTYSFSRVFFRLPCFYDTETPDQAREFLKGQAVSGLIRDAMKDNIGKLKIEYPNGTNMVWKLTPQDFK